MIEVREASAPDAPGIASLLAQLGYEVSTDSIRSHLAADGSSEAGTTMVAVDGVRLVGLIAVHRVSMLHRPKPVARITTMVVARDDRGRGIGRLLVDEAAGVAQKAGCDLMELTTAFDRKDAQGFYQAMGFTPSSLRFQRLLA